MQQTSNFFESVASFRKGSNAQGVRAELQTDSIPQEIKDLMTRKMKSSK